MSGKMHKKKPIKNGKKTNNIKTSNPAIVESESSDENSNSGPSDQNSASRVSARLAVLDFKDRIETLIKRIHPDDLSFQIAKLVKAVQSDTDLMSKWPLHYL